jgi:hypothetical protein
MHRSLAIAIVLGTLAASSVARAEPSFSDRFVRGTSPGEIPTGKLVTIGGFYTLSAASLGLGVVSLFSASDKAKQAEDFKLSQPRGFCRDLSSEACVSYHSLESDAANTRTLAVGLLGLGGLLAAGGAITAELWSNDASIAPTVAFEPGFRGGSLGLVGSF